MMMGEGEEETSTPGQICVITGSKGNVKSLGKGSAGDDVATMEELKDWLNRTTIEDGPLRVSLASAEDVEAGVQNNLQTSTSAAAGQGPDGKTQQHQQNISGNPLDEFIPLDIVKEEVESVGETEEVEGELGSAMNFQQQLMSDLQYMMARIDQLEERLKDVEGASSITTTGKLLSVKEAAAAQDLQNKTGSATVGKAYAGTGIVDNTQQQSLKSEAPRADATGTDSLNIQEIKIEPPDENSYSYVEGYGLVEDSKPSLKRIDYYVPGERKRRPKRKVSKSPKSMKENEDGDGRQEEEEELNEHALRNAALGLRMKTKKKKLTSVDTSPPLNVKRRSSTTSTANTLPKRSKPKHLRRSDRKLKRDPDFALATGTERKEGRDRMEVLTPKPKKLPQAVGQTVAHARDKSKNSGGRSFCTCGKSFSDEGGVYQHVRRSTMPPAFECDPCGKRFYAYSELRLHHHRHHPDFESLPEGVKGCCVCGDIFPSWAQLSKHKKENDGCAAVSQK